MKNLSKGTFFTVLLIFASILPNQIKAQCTKPLAETCDETNVFCSLNDLNGAFCTTGSSIPSKCYPLCSKGGKPDGTSWWGFVSQGGQVTLTLHVGSCVNFNNGLQWGIWGDCVCGEEILCRSGSCVTKNTQDVAVVTLKPCRTYYLWFDGCYADNCDITINTSGGAAPSLAPLGFINNKANMIIEPVCHGACGVLFFVNPQPGGCLPTYVWRLDGNEVGGNDNQIKLDFPDYGDFVLCVTAYLGNPRSGSICAKEGPRCTTIKVRPLDPKIGVPRTICSEAAHPSGYKWHSQKIVTSGTYKEQFTEPGTCCIYDSAVYFTVLDVPVPPDIYYITCGNEPYIDMLGKAHAPCKDHYEISLPKTNTTYKCDSTIRLSAVNINYDTRWKVQCIGGQIEISPNISIIKPCTVGETYQFDYRWYKKNSPGKNTISKEERLVVDGTNEDYCLDVTVRVDLGTEVAMCTKTFCESFNESDLIPYGVPISGDKTICVQGTGTYQVDTLITWKTVHYNWTIDGGSIITKKDSSSIDVKWNLPQGDTGKVCLYMNTDCGRSIERCIQVSFGKESAGRDFKQRDFIAKLNSPSKESGLWKLISGPGHVVFENPSNPKSRVRVDKYGIYCFEWMVNNIKCFITDTVCVQFYKLIYNPNNIFNSRNSYISEEQPTPFDLFSPNLISTVGTSYFTIDGDFDVPIQYTWYDHVGRIIINDKINIESGITKMNIESPLHQGFYFLAFEINGMTWIRKVCVIEKN